MIYSILTFFTSISKLPWLPTYLEINCFSSLLREYGFELWSLLQRLVLLKFLKVVSDNVIRFNAFALTLTHPVDSELMALSAIYLNSQKPSNVPKIRRWVHGLWVLQTFYYPLRCSWIHQTTTDVYFGHSSNTPNCLFILLFLPFYF